MEPCRRRAIWAARAAVTNQPEIKHETQDETRNDADAKTETLPDVIPDVSPYMCPKCKREYKRGMYFHQKYCRGL